MQPMKTETIPMTSADTTDDFTLPPLGDNPSSTAAGTTPGSFANRGRVGTPWTFSSPDTPGMPQPSDKTAWDFLAEGWDVEIVDDVMAVPASPPCGACAAPRVFTDSTGVPRRVAPPAGFEPVTQL